MAQKLNKKLVGFLVVSLMALMTVTGVVLIGNLPEQDPAKYAADGEKFMAEGDYDKALQSFQRAYSKDRAQNPDYLVKSARCALELGKVAEARTLIEYAKVRDQKNKAALELDLDLEFELAPLFGSINQWNQVIERARDMQEMDEFSGSAKVHYALGRAYVELRKEDATYESKGEAELKRAIELDPANVEAVTILAKQMSQAALEKEAERQREEAESIRQTRRAIVSAAIEKCPDPEKKSELRVLLAQCLINDGEAEKGVDQLKQIAARETTETTARLF
ncbi:MAG TPA: tetratricopeptide repeat protein, partial [Phycisphaerae bacterium]|nr:tetratricopeptide repeat protein [Phycisphaerae bacterium]